MASRQNTLFSITLVWFMVFKSHAPYVGEMSSGKFAFYWIVALVLIAVLELNALGFMPWKTEPKKGLNIAYDSVQNVLIAGFGLWVIFLIMWEIVKP